MGFVCDHWNAKSGHVGDEVSVLDRAVRAARRGDPGAARPCARLASDAGGARVALASAGTGRRRGLLGELVRAV